MFDFIDWYGSSGMEDFCVREFLCIYFGPSSDSTFNIFILSIKEKKKTSNSLVRMVCDYQMWISH